MSALWQSSIELMLLGMGTVFVFLILLVIATTAMSAVINKISPQATPATSHDDIDVEIAAAAAAAFARHKK